MKLEEQIQELERRWDELYDKRPRTEAEDKEKEKVGEALGLALRQQVKPLTDELAEVGIQADVWDLVNTSESYPDALPILVRHLSRPYHHRNKEGIVRALAVKEAKGIANKAVMKEYHRLPKENPEIDPDEQWIFHYRWAFGNTMCVIVTEDDLDELIEIVMDESNGASRDGFVEALGKLKSPKVVDVMKQLVNDKSPLVAQAAEKVLRKKSRTRKPKQG